MPGALQTAAPGAFFSSFTFGAAGNCGDIQVDSGVDLGRARLDPPHEIEERLGFLKELHPNLPPGLCLWGGRFCPGKRMCGFFYVLQPVGLIG